MFWITLQSRHLIGFLIFIHANQALGHVCKLFWVVNLFRHSFNKFLCLVLRLRRKEFVETAENTNPDANQKCEGADGEEAEEKNDDHEDEPAELRWVGLAIVLRTKVNRVAVDDPGNCCDQSYYKHHSVIYDDADRACFAPDDPDDLKDGDCSYQDYDEEYLDPKNNIDPTRLAVLADLGYNNDKNTNNGIDPEVNARQLRYHSVLAAVHFFNCHFSNVVRVPLLIVVQSSLS